PAWWIDGRNLRPANRDKQQHQSSQYYWAHLFCSTRLGLIDIARNPTYSLPPIFAVIVFVMPRGDDTEHCATRPHRLHQRIFLWKRRTSSGIKCPLRETSTQNTVFAVLGFSRISLAPRKLRIWTKIGNVAASQIITSPRRKKRVTSSEVCVVAYPPSWESRQFPFGNITVVSLRK